MLCRSGTCGTESIWSPTQDGRVGQQNGVKLHDSRQKALGVFRPTGNDGSQQRVHVI